MTKASFDFSGTSALVTGGAGTIGTAIAHELYAAGADLVLVDRRTSPSRYSPDRVRCLVGDLGDDGFLRTVSAVFDETGCSLLVNNAGLIDTMSPAVDISNSRFDEVIGVNLRAAFALSREAIRSWLASDIAGIIVNVSSVGGQRSHADNAAYDASKAGMDALTRSLAVDYGPSRIRVNGVAPAAVPSGPTLALDMSVGVPLRRAGLARDVACAVCFLASDASDFVNGHTLAVDGGIWRNCALQRILSE